MHVFLPKTPPIRNYITKARSLSNLTKVASELPKLLLTNKVQTTINNLKKDEFSIDSLISKKSEKEINLAKQRSRYEGRRTANYS